MDIPQVAFTRGEASPIAAARTDQSFYQLAVALAQNMFVRVEGGMSNRPGLQYIAACQSNSPNGSYLIPFIYNNVQSYLLEVAASPAGINFFANGAPVGTTVAVSYAVSDLPNLRWAQSADTLDLVVQTQPPQQIKRLTTTSFSFMPANLVNGPFQDINTDSTTYMYASATQGVVTITCSAPIFTPQHVGALITIQEQFENAVTPWTAEQFLKNAGAGSPIGLYTRSDSKIYQCVAWNSGSASAANGVTTGTFQPVHTSGTQADGNGQTVPNFAGVVGVSWQFVSGPAGCAQITAYIDANHVTAIVQSDKGVWSNFPPTVVGPPITVLGPFTFSGTGSTKTFSPLTAVTVTDPNEFLVTVGGVFQDPTTYSIVGTSIVFYTAPPSGTNNVVVTQVSGQGTGNSLIAGLPLSTYWAFGSFSPTQGYPSVVVYFNDRKVYAGTLLQPQSFFASQVSNYVDYGASTPQVDSDAIAATINARRENPIVDLIPLNDLLIGTASTVWRVTHSASVGAITPNDISLLPQNFYGQQAVPSVQTGDTVIYVQWGGRKIRDLVYQFAYDKFVGTELTAFARHIFPFGTTCVRMAYAPEPFGLLYCVRSDGVMAVCAYLPEQQVIAWTRYVTAGFFEDVQVLPENGTYAVYVIVRRVVNGSTVRYIERFAQREYVSANDPFFVDSGLTYDGRNTSNTTMTVSGTSWMAQNTGNLTASAPTFASTDPANGNAIWLTDGNGNRLCRLKITGYTNSQYVAVTFLDPVPPQVQSVSTLNWTYAKTNFSGLTNLTGATIAVFADGGVMPQQAVSLTGTFTLPTPGGVVHAGLPYIAQIQSLNLNMQGQPPIRNKAKTPSRLSVLIDSSTSLYGGSSFNKLYQLVVRAYEPYGQPVSPHTGVVHLPLAAQISDDAVVCLQHQDPVPLTVLGWFVDVSVGRAG